MASVGFSLSGWKGAMKAPKRILGPNMGCILGCEGFRRCYTRRIR